MTIYMNTPINCFIGCLPPLVAACVCIAGGGHAGTIDIPTEASSDGLPIISISNDLPKPLLMRSNTVVLCVWPNGRIIWSQDLVLGGPPYFVGQIGGLEINRAITNLLKLQVADDRALREIYMVTDGAFTTIEVQLEKKVFYMQSSHEYYEYIAKTQKPQHRTQVVGVKTRQIWTQVRTNLLNLIPKSGKVDSNIKFEFRQIAVD